MSRVSLCAIAFLSHSALFACGPAHAQGRPNEGSLVFREQNAKTFSDRFDSAARKNEMIRLRAWLGRLEGRFRIDGTVTAVRTIGAIQQSSVKGVADCVLFGNGPGVQCMINASWNDMYMDQTRSPVVANAYNVLKPMMMLFGLDPDLMGIQLAMVDEYSHHSVGQSNPDLIQYALRRQSEDACLRRNPTTCIAFSNETNCTGYVSHCWSAIFITAKPDGKLITMELGIPAAELTLRLHREPKKVAR